MSPNERPIQELMDLSGKVAIVTGATGWLGAAMSRALAEAGATLVVTSRKANRRKSSPPLCRQRPCGIGL